MASISIVTAAIDVKVIDRMFVIYLSHRVIKPLS